ncbi:putative nuclease HARBI1 [Dreissena polymorpha]|uniref:putative nuclease HARBI1 n=1 Tax=Dreissena polymorpha TaxID=45954 RepID=UPI002265642F|nr:putative nuclease HARBI1 [Dreissena polymorpha]
MRSLPVPVALAVCTFLRYVASGDLQLTVGDSTGLSQATLELNSLDVKDISDVVFFNSFPSTLGCMDCTHVHIKKPVDHVEDCIGRKGVPTINVQAVCDASYRIKNFSASWPGRTHDARFWRNCELKRRFENDYYRAVIEPP